MCVCAVWLLQDNLKKTIAYTLAHAVPEVWPLFLALVLNFPLGECCVWGGEGGQQQVQHSEGSSNVAASFKCRVL